MRAGAWIAAALLVACNGEDPPPSTESVPPRTIAAELAAAQCARMFDCCSGDELTVLLGPEADRAACEGALVSQADAFLVPALERAVAAETVALVADEIAACTQAIASTSCDDFEPLSVGELIAGAPCADIVTAKLTLSGFCTDDFECDTGFCSHPPADTEGTCKAPPQVGEPCLNDRCDSFLRCSQESICVEKLGQDEVCARNADCKSGRCEPNDDGEVVCAAPVRSCDG